MKIHLVSMFFACILALSISCGKNQESKKELETFASDYLKQTQIAMYKKKTIKYKSISGVDSNLLSLDIYYFGQQNKPVPVVVYVHGGGWKQGDKSNKLENKLRLFSSLNYLFISVNYRLSPFNERKMDPKRLMYPAHNQDVADALKWIFSNISTFGGNHQKIVLLGHSAGAHLVSLTATSFSFLPFRGIALNTLKGVASIDTEGYDVASQAGAGEALYLNAFGTNPNTWKAASPTSNILKGTAYPPFFIAKRGESSRVAIANTFISSLQNANVKVTQVQLNQYDHEGINDAIGAPGEKAITGPLTLFLAKCFE